VKGSPRIPADAIRHHLTLAIHHPPPNTHSPQSIEACISHHICSQQSGKLPHTYEISSNHPIIILLFSLRKHCWRTSAMPRDAIYVNSDILQSPRKVVAYAYI